ncbi:unnamed protein product [Heterobilharzia americana]|nr:unnamed protein product [Heterobilharzia americana]
MVFMPIIFLVGCKINIELREDPHNSTSVKLLGFYSHDAWRFLVRSACKRRSSVTREIFLRRTVDFAGPPIRMKITAKTTIEKVPIECFDQLNEKSINYDIILPDRGHLSNKQYIFTNTSNEYALINQNCSRDTQSFISATRILCGDNTKESKKWKTEKQKLRSNPVEILFTSSSPTEKLQADDDEQIIYPADRLRLPNLRLIMTNEQMDMAE